MAEVEEFLPRDDRRQSRREGVYLSFSVVATIAAAALLVEAAAQAEPDERVESAVRSTLIYVFTSSLFIFDLCRCVGSGITSDRFRL
jgi:hypothetical protein